MKLIMLLYLGKVIDPVQRQPGLMIDILLRKCSQCRARDEVNVNVLELCVFRDSNFSQVTAKSQTI